METLPLDIVKNVLTYYEDPEKTPYREIFKSYTTTETIKKIYPYIRYAELITNNNKKYHIIQKDYIEYFMTRFVDNQILFQEYINSCKFDNTEELVKFIFYAFSTIRENYIYLTDNNDLIITPIEDEIEITDFIYQNTISEDDETDEEEIDFNNDIWEAENDDYF